MRQDFVVLVVAVGEASPKFQCQATMGSPVCVCRIIIKEAVEIIHKQLASCKSAVLVFDKQ
jgi:hypothetical protein